MPTFFLWSVVLSAAQFLLFSQCSGEEVQAGREPQPQHQQHPRVGEVRHGRAQGQHQPDDRRHGERPAQDLLPPPQEATGEVRPDAREAQALPECEDMPRRLAQQVRREHEEEEGQIGHAQNPRCPTKQTDNCHSTHRSILCD